MICLLKRTGKVPYIMITKTSLKNKTFLLKIKAAICSAVKNFSQYPNHRMVEVHNRRGQSCLGIIALPGGKFRIQDREYNELTDMVLEALREFHKGN